jgi:hypothetical protein
MSGLAEEIERAVKYDKKHNARPVKSRDELPIAYEWITPEWLTDVLCREVSGAKVQSFELGESSNGTSNRRAISVVYNSTGTGNPDLPRKIFCKAAHDLANRIVVGGVGCADSESNFYLHVRPHMEIEAPVCYYAKVDPKTWNAMIILGDISDSVEEFCGHETTVTKARAMSELRLLAALHGRCYSDRALAAEIRRHFPTWRTFFNNVIEFGLKEGSEEGFRKSRGLIPDKLHARAAEIWPATVRSLARHDAEPLTLAHNDVHLKNWYVARTGEMGLGDWQCASRGHWSRDIAYALSCALTVEDRRAWERELLLYYIDQLAGAGGPRLSWDEVWSAYREQMITALTWWTITLNPAPGMPDMQPLDTTQEFVSRIGTAVDDLDTLDAFKE